MRFFNVENSLDYYSFGMLMPERNGGGDYRYSFNGMEKDDEVKGKGNHLDFGARCYDSRLGRWFSVDAHSKNYPAISPYVFVGNGPLNAIDPDGNDIIVLFASDAAGGAGHGAVLIGNEENGCFLFSKNGTTENMGFSGASNAHPENHIFYASINDFANSATNLKNGKQYYTKAFIISTNEDQDLQMKQAVAKQVFADYHLFANSCADTPSAALEAIGLDGGNRDYPCISVGQKPFEPKYRHPQIMKNNPGGSDISHLLTPGSGKGTALEGKSIVKIFDDAIADKFIEIQKMVKEGNFNSKESLNNAITQKLSKISQLEVFKQQTIKKYKLDNEHH